MLLEEVLAFLALAPGKTIVDATVGTGGHSQKILERILPGGRLVCIDRDQESLEVARRRLQANAAACSFCYGTFADIDALLAREHIDRVDGVLFDLGISSFQLSNPARGFSFQADGPLDMRLDQNSYISAYDLVNNLNEEEISILLRNFGQERWHNRIAHRLIQERKKHPITTTGQLSEIIVRAVPSRYRHYRIHPATRTFQAVRIAVNRELEVLERTIEKTAGLLKPGGRMCVISFHSLEDRIVKQRFRQLHADGLLQILTRKPVIPGAQETRRNPSSRSSKLRVVERI